MHNNSYLHSNIHMNMGLHNTYLVIIMVRSSLREMVENLTVNNIYTKHHTHTWKWDSEVEYFWKKASFTILNDQVIETHLTHCLLQHYA